MARSPKRRVMDARPSRITVTKKAHVQATQFSIQNKDGTPRPEIPNAKSMTRRIV